MGTQVTKRPGSTMAWRLLPDIRRGRRVLSMTRVARVKSVLDLSFGRRVRQPMIRLMNRRVPSVQIMRPAMHNRGRLRRDHADRSQQGKKSRCRLTDQVHAARSIASSGFRHGRNAVT